MSLHCAGPGIPSSANAQQFSQALAHQMGGQNRQQAGASPAPVAALRGALPYPTNLPYGQPGALRVNPNTSLVGAAAPCGSFQQQQQQLQGGPGQLLGSSRPQQPQLQGAVQMRAGVHSMPAAAGNAARQVPGSGGGQLYFPDSVPSAQAAFLPQSYGQPSSQQQVTITQAQPLPSNGRGQPQQPASGGGEAPNGDVLRLE